MNSKMTPRVALLLIAALFVLPLVLAWMMYSGAIEYRPGATRNQGRLVQPPQALSWESARLTEDGAQSPAADLGEHWVVLHELQRPCGQDCLDAVTDLRQVHRAAGRHQQRIRLALLLPPGAADSDVVGQLQEIYAEFNLLSDPGGAVRAVLEGIATEQGYPGAGATYLVDPLGNIMMFYEAGSDPNRLKTDLKRLMTWSKQDERT